MFWSRDGDCTYPRKCDQCEPANETPGARRPWSISKQRWIPQCTISPVSPGTQRVRLHGSVSNTWALTRLLFSCWSVGFAVFRRFGKPKGTNGQNAQCCGDKAPVTKRRLKEATGKKEMLARPLTRTLTSAIEKQGKGRGSQTAQPTQTLRVKAK